MSLIRLSAVFDFRPLDGCEALLGNAERANDEIIDRTLAQNENAYLQPMRQMDPGPSQHRGRWSTNAIANEKARRWWWRAVNKGLVNADSSGRYIRSGELNKQWRILRRGSRISLENTSPKARYVYSMAQTVVARGGVPNPGHIDTGWSSTAKTTTDTVVREVVSDVQTGWYRTMTASVASGQVRIVAGNRR